MKNFSEFVRPYVEQLKEISETDENRVVRIRCLGAIKATGDEKALDKSLRTCIIQLKVCPTYLSGTY